MRRLALSIALLVVASAYAGDLPEALRRAHEERLRTETGLVDWSREEAAGDRHVDARVRFYSTRVAGDTVLQSALGDEEGIVTRRVDGSIGPNARRASRSVCADGQIWTTREGMLDADLWMAGSRMLPPPDIRTFGVQPQPSGRSVYDPNWFGQKDLEAAEFREWTDGELRVIRAELPSGSSLQWWIDPQKGWSIVRANQFDAGGALKCESRSTLTEFDGVWLPSEITYFKSDFQAGKLPYQTIRIHSAEVNRPEQPARLGPGDLGLESGTTVTMRDAETGQGLELRRWDGSTLLTTKEWLERLDAGTASYSPAYLRELARGRAKAWKADPDPGVNWAAPGAVALPVGRDLPNEGPWEKYTREFISRYQLNDEQAQRAWLICRECEADRDAYLRQHHADFAELDKRHAAAKDAPAPTAAETEKLAERRRELEMPVERIFEERLKPRLEKLPTREQRERAEGQTTRPTGNP